MRSTSSSMPVLTAETASLPDGRIKEIRDPGFGVYVHWPFCLSKCPYCDFNSHVREAIDQERWGRALTADLESALDTTSPEVVRSLTSVFFGGGTPSLMAPAIVEDVLAALSRRGLLDAKTEITLEANPSSAEAERFAAYRDAGVNRLSVGVQALDNQALRFLGAGSRRRRSNDGGVGRPRGLRSGLLRPHIRPGGAIAAGMADRTRSGSGSRADARVPLSADHRTRHALSRGPGARRPRTARRRRCDRNV